MPRQKRALDETDANAQPAAKRSSTGKSSNVATEKPAKKQASTAKSTKEVAEKTGSTAKPANNQSSTSEVAKNAADKAAEDEESTEKPAEMLALTEQPTEAAVEERSRDGDSAENPNTQDSSSSTDKHGLGKKPPGEYICIVRPLFDFVAERENKEADEEEDEEDDEEAAHEAYIKEAQGPNRMWPKPAGEHPDWKWVMMVGAWKEILRITV